MGLRDCHQVVAFGAPYVNVGLEGAEVLDLENGRCIFAEDDSAEIDDCCLDLGYRLFAGADDVNLKGASLGLALKVVVDVVVELRGEADSDWT